LFVEKKRWDFLASHSEDPRIMSELLHDCEELTKSILNKKFSHYHKTRLGKWTRQRPIIIDQLLNEGLINEYIQQSYESITKWNSEIASFYSYVHRVIFNKILYNIRRQLENKNIVFQNEMISLEEYYRENVYD
jgi:hypothetical protein